MHRQHLGRHAALVEPRDGQRGVTVRDAQGFGIRQISSTLPGRDLDFPQLRPRFELGDLVVHALPEGRVQAPEGDEALAVKLDRLELAPADLDVAHDRGRCGSR
jgi:hypothetical protein